MYRVVVATVCYVPPEINMWVARGAKRMGQHRLPSRDVFSLGVVFAEVYGGIPPNPAHPKDISNLRVLDPIFHDLVSKMV